jgi:hypothetical protein
MEEQKRAVQLIKFGKKIHMEAFQDGEIFMNTLNHFQNLENCELRGDKDEGLSAIYQANGATLSRKNDEGEFVPIGTINDQLQYREEDSAHINVFCMYAIQVEPKKQKIDKRNLKFGDTFVLLLDPTEFLNRVKGAAEQKGIKVYHNLVEYVEREKHNGPIGPFRKFSEFSYQNEFRIIISRKSQEPYKLNVGDISDITELGRLSYENVNTKAHGII